MSARQGRLIAGAVRQAPGDLSPDQVERVAEDLVARADELTPSRTPALVREAVARQVPGRVVESPQERLAAQARRVRARRHLRFGADGDGGVDIRGNLPAAEAAGVMSVLEAVMAGQWRARREARDRLDPRDESTPDQRRADALVALLQQGGAAGGCGAGLQVFVTMRAEELRTLAVAEGVLADGTELSAGELRRLCCEAELIPVVLGGDSEILDQGRGRRLATPAIRRALVVRGRGVCFPGVRRRRRFVSLIMCGRTLGVGCVRSTTSCCCVTSKPVRARRAAPGHHGHGDRRTRRSAGPLPP
ncbi:hypothetical protein CGZ93_04625 [Enemella dayhoffiae]|uniref:DUF222 domain-containing protein n=1 Tax=Enemella dayhoffiae TaxID=2016507 RepID=A0A255H939_9ACTN|nr:hypothetical protein CGZ93_04625 [Enemella dayhoffiae]